MQTQGGLGLRVLIEKGSCMVDRVLWERQRDPMVLEGSPVLGTRSWSQERSEEL